MSTALRNPAVATLLLLLLTIGAACAITRLREACAQIDAMLRDAFDIDLDQAAEQARQLTETDLENT